MNASFYTASLGARGQQDKMDIISNNVANVNTAGYKIKTGTFSDLIHYQMRQGVETGSGMRMAKVDTDFSNAGYLETGLEHDYAIEGEGFFMLQDPASGQIAYTRDGNFSMSRQGDVFYLVGSDGKRVLDAQRNPVVVEVKLPPAPGEEVEDANGQDGGQEGQEEDQGLPIGVFRFQNRNGMQSVGHNEFVPVAKNGQPTPVANPRLRQGMLENSNVDFGKEMARMVETQRAYSYALKLLQVSDEAETMVNSLR